MVAIYDLFGSSRYLYNDEFNIFVSASVGIRLPIVAL